MRSSKAVVVLILMGLAIGGFVLVDRMDQSGTILAANADDDASTTAPAGYGPTSDEGTGDISFSPVSSTTIAGEQLSSPTTFSVGSTPATRHPLGEDESRALVQNNPEAPSVAVEALPAPTTTVPAANVEERGQAALAALAYPWQTLLPGWEIRFHGAQEGAYGYTITQEKRIDVYVRPDQSDELLRHVIAHELGHAIDVTLNDGDERRRWQEARGIEDEPWWPNDRASDFSTGAGDFAESFAAWQVGPASFRSNLGDPPNTGQIALLAELSAG